METSAKTNINVEKAFMDLSASILEKMDKVCVSPDYSVYSNKIYDHRLKIIIFIVYFIISMSLLLQMLRNHLVLCKNRF